MSVSPGLYKHYKGNLYRVLFLAGYSESDSAPLKPDDGLVVWHSISSGEVLVSKRVDWMVKTNVGFLNIKWSGNEGVSPAKGESIIVYVGLYGEGRVSARTEKEFAEMVSVLCDLPKCAVEHERPRFERVGE